MQISRPTPPCPPPRRFRRVNSGMALAGHFGDACCVRMTWPRADRRGGQGPGTRRRGVERILETIVKERSDWKTCTGLPRAGLVARPTTRFSKRHDRRPLVGH